MLKSALCMGLLAAPLAFASPLMAFVESVPLQPSNLDSLSEAIDTLAITLREGLSLRIAPPAML